VTTLLQFLRDLVRSVLALPAALVAENLVLRLPIVNNLAVVEFKKLQQKTTVAKAAIGRFAAFWDAAQLQDRRPDKLRRDKLSGTTGRPGPVVVVADSEPCPDRACPRERTASPH
jgi:hypothetical protein